MKYKYTFSILLLFITIINVYGQTTENLKKPKYKRVSEAYGYVSGQEYSLNLIKKEFPQYEMSVLKAQMSFNSTFGKAKEGMKKYLSEYLGQNEFIEYEDKLISEMKKMLGNQTFTEEIATNFISEVESRAKGNIASTVLETLLSFQFSDRPQDELTSGFTTTFKTKGHLKSKNTDWQIKVPKSWKAEEADRPNIIQKFTNDYGSGNQAIMIMVKEMPLPKGYKITKEELNDLFTEKEMKDMVPDGGKFISFTKMTLDNNIGGMMEFEQTVERLDFKIKIRMVQFMFIRGNKMYTLQGTVGSEKPDTDLSLEMKKYLPLYKLVANTIVVNDQYK
jgi:hypothetical protein